MAPLQLISRAALAVLLAAVLLLAAHGGAQAPLVDDRAGDHGYGAGMPCAAEEGCAGGEAASSSSRRELGGRNYIGYDALRRNAVPCSYRGASYYNCRPGGQANPYSRGCSAITRCRG